MRGLLFLFASFAQVANALECGEIDALIHKTPPDSHGKVNVSFGPGTYICKNPIVIDRDNVILKGIGRPLLKLSDTADSPVIIVGDVHTIRGLVPEAFIKEGFAKEDAITAKRVKHIHLSGFKIDGNKDNQTEECWASLACDSNDNEGKSHIRNNGITIRGAEDVWLDDIEISDVRSGAIVSEKFSRNLHVSNIKAVRSFFDGFAGYQTIHSTFENMVLSDNESAGISLDLDFNHNTFRNIRLIRNGHSGIFMRMGKGVLFDHMILEENGQVDGAPAVFFAQWKDEPLKCVFDTTLSNSLIKKNKGMGVRINDSACTGNRLTNITFEGNLRENISIADSANPILSGIIEKPAPKLP